MEMAEHAETKTPDLDVIVEDLRKARVRGANVAASDDAGGRGDGNDNSPSK